MYDIYINYNTTHYVISIHHRNELLVKENSFFGEKFYFQAIYTHCTMLVWCTPRLIKRWHH
jgi:hypothetical protein